MPILFGVLFAVYRQIVVLAGRAKSEGVDGAENPKLLQRRNKIPWHVPAVVRKDALSAFL